MYIYYSGYHENKGMGDAPFRNENIIQGRIKKRPFL
jgi:hypothetical protein